VMHFSPKQPMLEARTATGGTFHSNGQVLVMKLSQAAKGSTTSAGTSR